MTVRDPAEMSPEEEAALDAARLKELEASAHSIICQRDVLAAFAEELRQVIAGEERNAKLLYLSGTSRLFPKTMHVAIKGTSSGGKSELRKRVEEFFPPESVVSFTSMSEKALIYHEGDFTNKILSLGEAAATEEQSFQDYLLRELMSEGKLRHQSPQKTGSGIVTVTIEKNGPVAFWVTTTKNKLHPENETRMISLEIDDSESQTRAVLRKVAQVEGLNRIEAQVDRSRWHDFQRWLEAGERRVVVPFAASLSDKIPAASVRLRRDFGQIIRAIKAHALLHREHRERDGLGQIVASLDDYRAVADLMGRIVAESSGVAVNPEMQETIDAVALLTKNMPDDQGASALDIARQLKLDKSAAWRRLKNAQLEGFVVNLEARRGQPGRYRRTTQKIEPMELLPPAEALTPSKTAQPCNPTGIAQFGQRDSGCTAGCTGVATASPVADTRNPVATAHATAKQLTNNGKEAPVARLHADLGGDSDDDDDAPEPGSFEIDPWGTGRDSASAGQQQREDDDLEIPDFLRRGAAA